MSQINTTNKNAENFTSKNVENIENVKINSNYNSDSNSNYDSNKRSYLITMHETSNNTSTYLPSENDYKTTPSDLHHYIHFIAGAISGFCSRTITAPLERLKILYQVNYKSSQTPNIFIGLKDLYIKDGIKGLFRGNLINLIKSTPDMAIKLYIFEKAKSFLRLRNGSGKHELSTIELFLAGAAAGATANFSVFPLDVVKTRLSAAPNGTYNGIWDTFVKTYKDGGIVKFYKGVDASILIGIPNSGLQLCFYDLLKRFFSINNRDSVNSSSNTNLSTIKLMFIGGSSAMMSSTLLYPLQTIQARIIMHSDNSDSSVELNSNTSNKDGYKYKHKYSNNSSKNNIFSTVASTIKIEGIRGFYKGYAPGITKITIGNAVSFSLYENIKPLLSFL